MDEEKYFRELIYSARINGATDIILREGENVYLRILNSMEKSDELCSSETMKWMFNYFNSCDRIGEKGDRTDIDSSFEDRGRYRVNLFTSDRKMCSVIRIIRNKIPELTEIGVSLKIPEVIHENRGLNLIVGKTGSGKSTTMASVIKYITDRWPWHIITLEDPIEYRFQCSMGLVTQRELGSDFLSFREGIKSALRQSPDLIMIGEIRDYESLKAAIEAAESGTGVLCSMHSLGAEKTLSRMLALFPGQERDFARFSISSCLNLIQSQILFEKDRKLNMDYELLFGNRAVRATIREGRMNQLDNLILLGKSEGMKKFDF